MPELASLNKLEVIQLHSNRIFGEQLWINAIMNCLFYYDRFNPHLNSIRHLTL